MPVQPEWFVLVIWVLWGSATPIPVTQYPSEEQCRKAGEVWLRSGPTRTFNPPGAGYACIPSPRPIQ